MAVVQEGVRKAKKKESLSFARKTSTSILL